ncbi:hypothetical protein QUF80_04225 [Desulfococcaceae bacterium HSG8]|nr:hypothetical protein [Desulfococcaceae bacterium HSG8]
MVCNNHAERYWYETSCKKHAGMVSPGTEIRFEITDGELAITRGKFLSPLETERTG